MAILQSATWRSSWGWTCLAAAGLIVSASAAEARDDPRIKIDIEATSLPEAIAELAREAFVSVGTEGSLPRIRTQSLQGRMTVDAALARLLHGTGYATRRVSATAWRIERAPNPTVPPPPPAAPGTPEIATEEIVVNATKRDLTLDTAPLAASVVQFTPAERLDPGSNTQRVAQHLEGLSLTGQGPGRNRMFLRGVADSPFGGKSQATVAVLLDDARLTYVAPDPDIRLVDVDRVELLKGPQGSLYGSGALGGIYRIVTNRADPSKFSIGGSVTGEAVAAGEIGGGGSVVVNVPLVADVMAIRLVGYGEESPGWLNTGSRKDSNGSTVVGVRGGLGIEPGGGWRVDATGFGQWLQAKDSNYTYQPKAHDRPAQLPEPHDNDLVHASLRLAHDGAMQVVLSSGYTVHDVNDRYDATQGADSFALPNPQTLDDDAHYRLWDSEARMTGKLGRIAWLGGLSYVQSWQNSVRTLTDAGGTQLVIESVDRHESEAALFGEGTLPLSDAFDATLGGRLFDTILHERRAVATDEGRKELSQTGITPSASLSWHPHPGRLVYLRYGAAQRQGGTTVDPNGAVQTLDEDKLTTLESGWRETAGAVDLDLGVYQSWWHDIQSDVLLTNGLVETANVGDGSITGAELSVKARVDCGWQIEGGAMVQSALLTRDMSGLKLHDRRLPVVPSWTLRGSLARGFTLRSWDATLSANARYVGPARLSFDPALDRPMGNYLETGIGLEARRGRWSLALEGRNLFNARGDSFVYGNPLRIFSTQQYVRQDPFSLRFSVAVVP
ncbi:MAG: TonB-dependent receptor domain-containing protein [Croceibacterium sp.]